MHRHNRWKSILIALAAFVCSALPLAAQQKNEIILTIRVTGARNAKGIVRVLLFRGMSRSHMNPAQAVMAAEMLGAHTMLPVHFETFINSLDRKEQCRDALKAATLRSVSTRVVPWHIGDSVELMPAN
jgi:hypothetical protein